MTVEVPISGGPHVPDGGPARGPGPVPVPAALTQALEAELPAAVALRRALHREPRVSGDETDSRDAVAEALGRTLEPVAGTGGLLRLGGPGPAVAVRGELDALPVHEDTGLPFASRRDGVAHVCGHDVHTAALVALTRAVAATPDLLAAPLLAVFQPREEAAPSGAADVVVDAAFTAHDPAVMLGVHVQPELPRGVVSARPGPVNASADEIEITVTGRAGHGGYPHRTRDPVLAVAAVVVALQQIVARRVNPLEAAVVTIGQITAGSAPNVVPGGATARGTVRALDADRDAVLAAVTEVVEHTAAAHGCTGEVAVVPNEPAVVNDDALTAAIAATLGGRRGAERAAPTGLRLDTGFRSCGADDFSHYSAAGIPSTMLFVGTAEPDAVPGHAPGLHHPAFSPDDAMVGEVARALLAAVVAAGQTLPASHAPQRPSPDGGTS
ncbi:M20 metallopeptidase family protein [Actinomycetospora soli]|uniref:M20 metallopeptidase family protein n=1 Tax=Actinomycetospora soli TaxID=2893887 RepID=UPI001E500A5E|nr:amidohydrolase [Actinomycetospora soli]MCD2188056.1 amidohydrolase [Actinomycetospora soli]